MKTDCLKLSRIITTAGTQIRAKIDTDTVDDYATAMAEPGNKFPPVIVFHDGSEYILADGFHRVMAAARNGYLDIEAEVRKGTKDDALRFALDANAAHGLKRSNADKRRSVELALAQWPKMSNRELERICCVSDSLVADVRASQLPEYGSSTRIGADGKERKLPTAKAKSNGNNLAGGMVSRESPERRSKVQGSLPGSDARGNASETPPATFAKAEQDRLAAFPQEKTPCRAIIDALKRIVSDLESYERPRPDDEWNALDFSELSTEVQLIAKNIRKLGDPL